MASTSDVLIVGGGIVGLASARQLLQKHPRLKVVLLEKEARLAQHQTGRNSGVLHSGIYYRPGTMRARVCRAGKAAMERFCAEQGVAHEICGKVIVAVDSRELPALERIHERGLQNGVRCELIGPERLRELEPGAAGVRAIHVPEAGIVDYGGVCDKLAESIRARGGEIVTGAKVFGFDKRADEVVTRSTQGEHAARLVVTCAGLYSDRVAKLTGDKPPAKIVPFRGEYYELRPEAEHLCRNLIYPVPDPRFPFLGVHFTRMALGGVECGPNAVLAFAREGYRKLDINPRDLFESLTYSGFLRLCWKNWRVGLVEMWRSWSKAAFVKALQRLVPEIRAEHLQPGPAGVRAQLLGRDGALVDDFVIQSSPRVVNVCNAPSPAATAALAIGEHIVAELEKQL